MSLGKYNVLIAHSDDSVRSKIQAQMSGIHKNLGFFFANDGPQVIRMIEQTRINFLFLDMQIPKKPGEGVLLDIMRVSMDRRPGLVYLLSKSDCSKYESKSKKMQISYLPSLDDFKMASTQIQNYINPAKVKSEAASCGDGKQNLDVKLMNPIVDATLNVFEVMINLKPEKVNVSVEKAFTFFGDISAYYPIKSDKFDGFFCISFPKESYLKTMSAMLFEEFEDINNENMDGVGELCNQIFGNSKAHFNENMESHIEMATPIIELKEISKVITSLKGSKVVIEFKTEAGHFFVEVAMIRK